MLTFRRHYAFKRDKNLHGEDLLSGGKWGCNAKNKRAFQEWRCPSSAPCQSWDLKKKKKSGRSITLAHEKWWNSPQGNVFAGRRCKWLFNKGIGKSAVNAGLRCAEPEWRAGEERAATSNYPARLSRYSSACCISQVRDFNKRTRQKRAQFRLLRAKGRKITKDCPFHRLVLDFNCNRSLYVPFTYCIFFTKL